jgi:Xaa-Pro aminopeptidase
MAEAGIDVLITHACECESANVRYLSNFWAVFDFAGVIVPIEGDAILFTGGPESYDFARRFAQIDDIRINPLYVETSAPEWDKETDSCSYGDLFDEFRHRFVIKQIGVANTNILPYRIMNEIRSAAKDATIVSADDLLLKLRWTKSPNEIIMMKEAYRITE